jgi:hypothetical protein
MTKWEAIPQDEKESLISVDYSDKVISVYTSNKATGNKLFKSIGKPKKTIGKEDNISSVEWIIPFTDRKAIRKAFSINAYVSHHQSLEK